MAPARQSIRQRPPPWRDVRVLRTGYQAVVLAVVGWLLWFFASSLLANLRATSLPTGYDFLGRPTGIDIRGADFRPAQPITDALLVGAYGTLRVAVVGIVAATVLGVLLGIARLSGNWLVRRSAAVYVELFRNVPVLVIIIFMYTAVVLRLPQITEAAEWLGAVVLSNRGIWLPWGEGTGSAEAFLSLCAVAALAALVVGRWRTRVYDETGAPHHRMLWGMGVLIAVIAAGYVAFGAPVQLSLPLRDGRVVAGGIQLGTSYAAVLIGLVVYTASHIGEIVRGSILAVPRGQKEAADALALSSFQRMRFVVLPQALRIMVPPLANQYLNLTKNSSLAVAVGYAEVTLVTTQVIANGNPAPQMISLLMLTYLVFSLVISLVTNVVNRRLTVVTR